MCVCVCVCVWVSVLFFTVSLLSEPVPTAVPTAVPAAVPAAATPPVSVAELNIPEDDGLGNIIYAV